MTKRKQTAPNQQKTRMRSRFRCASETPDAKGQAVGEVGDQAAPQQRQRVFVVGGEQRGRQQRHGHAAQRAARGDGQVEPGDARFRFGAHQLAVADHAANEERRGVTDDLAPDGDLRSGELAGRRQASRRQPAAARTRAGNTIGAGRSRR